MDMIVLRRLSAGQVHIDEGTQAIVLAEIAACIFVSRCPVAYVCDGLKADEGCLSSVGPEPQRLLRCSDCAGAAAVIMHDNLWLFAIGAEAGLDEIHLCLDHGEIILRAALKDETCTEGCEIRNSGNVEEDVFGKHIGESRKDLLRSPTLPLK